MQRRALPPMIVIVTCVTALGAVACGGAAPTDQSVVFAEGSIPASLPRDFPVPANAAIGTSIVDRVNNRTEISMTMRSDLTAAVQFFQVGLVNQGYVVDRSEAGTQRGHWRIGFLKGELRGEIELNATAGVSQVFISINTS